jgi:long-chain fatty acid transport protein
MKGIAVTAGVLMVASTAATAGGVEKSNQSVAILFEEGSYAQLSFGSFSPNVSGTTLAPVGPFIPGFNSGNMAGRTTSLSFGYKQALSDRMDLAIIVDEPIGAKVRYPGTFGLSPYPLAGTTADLTSDAITALLRYKMQNNVSVYGGLRYQTVKGVVSIPFVGAPGPGYTLTTNNDGEFGYVVGVAWERPEIAARVALTYNAAITHTLDSVEGGPVPRTGSFETEVPQSVNLEFQTGIAQDTLLFGSIRWVDWSAFQIAPTGYGLAVEARAVVRHVRLGQDASCLHAARSGGRRVVSLFDRLPDRHPLHGRIHCRQLQARGDEEPVPARPAATDSVYIASNITFNNLAPLSTYLGKPGDPALGGLEFDEYMRRQDQHRAGRDAALLDTTRFIERARDIYGYPQFPLRQWRVDLRGGQPR